ncbi:MAG: glycosyltransferase [Alphaproteobacteria bacterium]
MVRDTIADTIPDEYHPNRGADYGASYFQNAEGSGYTDYLTLARGPNRHLAETLVTLFQPSSALDMGCAVGYVVKRLRELGVDAYGYDISEWAVHKADAPYIQVLDIATTEISRQFDLVICYDLLEHIEESRLSFAIQNLWASAARYLVVVPALYEEGTLYDTGNSNVRTFHDYAWWLDFMTANCNCIFDRDMSVLLAQQEHSQDFNYSDRIFVFKKPLSEYEAASQGSLRHDAEAAVRPEVANASAKSSEETSISREPSQAQLAAGRDISSISSNHPESAPLQLVGIPQRTESITPDLSTSPSKAKLPCNGRDISCLSTTATLDSRHTPMRGADIENRLNPTILFDISDLIYYIGEHPNLSGIQRVQSSIIISILRIGLYSHRDLVLLSFESQTRRWMTIPTGFLLAVLEDLFLPESSRMVRYPMAAARCGVLPGAKEFDGTGILDDVRPSVLCLLGAAWVHRDYVHRVLDLKRRFGTRFAMAVHDLIPIYARETCDQDTAHVFEEFMTSALRHVDHILSVSQNTAGDLKRYLQKLGIKEPPITVTRNGSSFDEFLPKNRSVVNATELDIPIRFVLFVATIEGRKNHQLMLKLWERMIADGDDPPVLVCVGRLGWKSSDFLSRLIETDYLQGKIVLLRDISDTHLRLLYEKCLFTVCPTFYEGWGLPVGESLALGKICVCSDRASLPEVAGDYGLYINIDDFGSSLSLVRELIRDDERRNQLEENIRLGYPRISWGEVAGTIIRACITAADTKWDAPYPYALIPYRKELTFARLDRNIDGTGELLLSRLMSQRQGRYLDFPLDEQAFILGNEIRSDGFWAYSEDWGTWSCFSGGGIVLALESDSSEAFYVFLGLRVNGLLADGTIRISANQTLIWKGSVGSSGRDIALRIPREILTSNGWNIRLNAQVQEFPEALQKQIATVDQRVPSIGFERLIVVPENDVETRLDILCRLLL